MEVAVIDWKNIDSRFVKDELYEHINAPKWVDFSSAQDIPVDDEAWFCRPGCKHPKMVEDFFNEKERTPTSNSKIQKSVTVSSIPPFGDRNKREATLKKRGVVNQSVAALSSKDSKHHQIVEDGENQDPNSLTPLNPKVKVGKKAIKSSVEKNESCDDATNMRKEQTPKLKSTLSARNLFAGGDLLSRVAEFCNELKKLAIKAKDKENGGTNLEGKDRMDNSFGVLADNEKESKPLLEMSKEKGEVMETSGSKGLRRKKTKNDDGENTPVSLDVKKIKQQGAEVGLQQIRTCPPTPQCFSAGHGPPNASTPKPFKTTKALNQERGILQELKQTNREANREEKNNHHGEIAGKPLDVFWFLKPCTLSS